MPWNPLSCTCGKYVLPQRITMVIFLHIGLLHAYSLRIVLNVAMTEIAAPRNDSNMVDACPELQGQKTEIHESRYSLSSNEEALFLYAFYIGSIVSHLPGGVLADLLGPRHVMGVCMVISAVTTMFFPLTLNSGGKVPAIVLRALIGVAQGPLYPAVSTFIQYWIPSSERSLLGPICYSGASLGCVIGSIFTGMMIEQSRVWSLPFYVWGVLAIVWYLFYIPMVFSRPYMHPFITEGEATFLADQIKRDKQEFKIPWLKIMTSIPVWALLSGHMAHNLLFFIVFTNLPKYFKEILKTNIQDNAIFTAIPFGLLWMSTMIFGGCANYIIKKKWLTVRQTRIIFTGVSVVIPSVFLVLTTHIGCNRQLAITTYTLAVFTMGPFVAGMKVNVNDITVHYSGTVMGTVSGVAASGAIIGPAIVGLLSQDGSLEAWQSIYLIIFGISNLCGLLYYIFTETDRQPWDFPEEIEQPEMQ